MNKVILFPINLLLKLCGTYFYLFFFSKPHVTPRLFFQLNLLLILLLLLQRDFLPLNSQPSVSVFYFHPLSVPLFPLFLLPVFPFFPFVASILPSLPVPGDGHLTPGTRSQRIHRSPTNAALPALRLASCTAPSLVPVALSPKGNSHQRQWAAYQGKQQPAPCQPATKAQSKGKKRANMVQYHTAQ